MGLGKVLSEGMQLKETATSNRSPEGDIKKHHSRFNRTLETEGASE